MTPAEAYRVLDIEPGAGPEAVQEAYRKAALRTHPDRTAGYGLGVDKHWLRVRDAYECLRATGFPTLPPAEGLAGARRDEPRRYRAPEWLERQWANESGERFTELLKLDEHERAALRRLLAWLLIATGVLALVYQLRQRASAARPWRLSPGVTLRSSAD